MISKRGNIEIKAEKAVLADTIHNIIFYVDNKPVRRQTFWDIKS